MSAPTTGSTTIRRVTGALGAEVKGLDLRNVGDDEVGELRAALVEHQVVVVRNQSFTPRELKEFFVRFGDLTEGVIRTRSRCADEPDVLVLETMNPGDAGRWHTDHSFVPEPPMAACLYAVELPAVGGDTCFGSMFAAYDALSAPMRALLDGLTAVHSNEALLRRFAVEDRNVTADSLAPLRANHPVVRTHPESGRKSIFYSSHAMVRIVELSELESAALIAFLGEWVKEPRFQLRIAWEPQTFVMWDERSTVHCGVADYHERRILHRLMLAGDAPV